MWCVNWSEREHRISGHGGGRRPRGTLGGGTRCVLTSYLYAFSATCRRFNRCTHYWVGDGGGDGNPAAGCSCRLGRSSCPSGVPQCASASAQACARRIPPDVCDIGSCSVVYSQRRFHVYASAFYFFWTTFYSSGVFWLWIFRFEKKQPRIQISLVVDTGTHDGAENGTASVLRGRPRISAGLDPFGHGGVKVARKARQPAQSEFGSLQRTPGKTNLNNDTYLYIWRLNYRRRPFWGFKKWALYLI